MELILTFPQGSVSDQGRCCAQLAEFLHSRSELSDIHVSVAKNHYHQDFGSTLVLILGTPALVALAEGLRVWLQKHHGVTLSISDGSRQLKIENVTAATAEALVREFTGSDAQDNVD